MSNKISLLLLVFFSTIKLLYSQTTTEKTFCENFLVPLKQQKLELIDKRKEILKDSFLFFYVKNQKKYIEKLQLDTINKKLANTKFKKVLYHINLGDYFFLKNDLAIKKYLSQYEKAYRISKKINNDYLMAEVIRRFCFHYFNTQVNNKKLDEYLKLYQSLLIDNYEKFYFNFYSTGAKMQLASKNNSVPNKQLLTSLINQAKKINLNFLVAESYQLNGAYDLIFTNNKSDALNNFAKSKNHYSLCKNALSKLKIAAIETNEAYLLLKDNKPQQAIEKLKQIDSLKINNLRYKLSVNQFLKEAFVLKQDYKSAYNHLNKVSVLKDSLSLRKQHTEMEEIRAKYNLVEKENLLLIETQKKKQNRNIAISLGGFLLFGSIVAFLLQKNSRRKRLIAEQENEIQTQKLSTVLKEQELNAIDAMIEGQEKERQRIANDLHDDLGSLMATVKLQFNALKTDNTPELLNKTTNLIDEAYNKIRSIAHAKNSGVIANQGLLVAVKNMAHNISSANKLQIDVVDFGLDKRLENSLELSIFRIIQELITNIIKHAKAKTATINLTQHEEFINIMVEDDGKGFKTSQVITQNSGMGLSSIDKRVEHLGGKMQIESEINNGTTIIIDIPL